MMLRIRAKNVSTSLGRFASLCASLEKEPGRKNRAGLLAEFLKGLDPEEIKPAVLLLLAQVLPKSGQRSLDIGYSTVKRAISSGQRTFAVEDTTILGAHAVLEKIARAEGPGSRRTKENLLSGLLAPLSDEEREYLLRSLFGEMRIGVNEGVLLEGLALATKLPVERLREAQMLTGDLPLTAEIALTAGEAGLGMLGAKLFTPIKPMLAGTAQDVKEAIGTLGRCAFEFKLDGARIQVHKSEGDVRIFSRRLTDVTSSVPEIAEEVRSEVKCSECVLEGEVIAFKGRPLPFQEVMRRFTRVHGIEDSSERVPLKLYLFDALLVDGRLLIDEPYTSRYESLKLLVPHAVLPPRIVTEDASEAQAFFERSLAEGNEGLVAKALDGTYSVGRRGKRWLKVKRAITLDLVIVAAEWGYGRRTGWLSDYYLGARTERGFEVVGKTFKGFTDEQFKSITQRLLALKTDEGRHVVNVRPEIVVEVAFDEIQRSPNYPSGFALRFARIKAIRDDKRPEEADLLKTVSEIYEKQFETKGRLDGAEPPSE
ncbi:MAG TPA: ATP-dependent DNA ligase [Methanomassiliicoccales archaeon]|nr:ATP-dependent DNA ligase [Methanomassiliicoccales archaeon]